MPLNEMFILIGIGLVLGVLMVAPLALYIGYRKGFEKALYSYLYMDFRIIVEGTLNKKLMRNLWHGMDPESEDAFDGLANFLDSLAEEE